MAVSIYLSNNMIRAVVGARAKDRIKIERQITKEIPEGSLINGVITNAAELEQELHQFFEENGISKREVFLVVHSSKFVSKQMNLPKVKKVQLDEMVVMEFADVERYSDAAYDYTFMPGNNKNKKNLQEVLGVMADKGFIQEYVDLFERIGVKLAGFSNSMASVVNVFAKIDRLKDESCIIHILDGNNMESVIWANGEFKQSTNRRLFNERGSREFGTEIIRHTSTSLQFYESLRLNEKLDQIYICGATKEEIMMYEDINEDSGMDLTISALQMKEDFKGLEEGERIADYVYPIGGLIKCNKEIDFLKVYKKDEGAKEKAQGIKKLLMPVALVLIVCLIGTAISAFYYGANRNKVAELDAYLDNPVNIEKADEADAWDKEINDNNLIIDDLTNVKEMVSSYPLINNQLVQLIASVNTTGVSGTILNYSAEKGTLTIEAKASDVTLIHSYVAALKNTKAFNNVEYTGYSFNSNDNNYSINVIGHLNEKAGR